LVWVMDGFIGEDRGCMLGGVGGGLGAGWGGGGVGGGGGGAFP